MTPSNLPPWDPDEHDRAILAERRADDRVLPVKDSTSASTFNYDGRARGQVTDAELQRRKQAEKAMRRRARLTKYQSQPRLIGGRWEARRHIDGRRHRARFDTRAEAQAWLDNLGGDER